MLATLADAPLRQKGLVYEPKYDGIRALVEITPGARTPKIHIWSRNGNEKTAQFPEIVRAMEASGKRLKAALVLDGEIVAIDDQGRPGGFQRLQGRMVVDMHQPAVTNHVGGKYGRQPAFDRGTGHASPSG